MNKKQEILDAAFSLLKEAGDVSQLNLRKIARSAGCAHTNVYNYFPNFEALKWAMLEEALNKLEAFMFETSGYGAVSKQPDELISRYIDFALENPELYKLIWITDLASEAAPADTAFLHKIPARLAEILPEESADFLHSYVHGKLLNIIFSRLPADSIDEQKELMLENCRRILLP